MAAGRARGRPGRCGRAGALGRAQWIRFDFLFFLFFYFKWKNKFESKLNLTRGEQKEENALHLGVPGARDEFTATVVAVLCLAVVIAHVAPMQLVLHSSDANEKRKKKGVNRGLRFSLFFVLDNFFNSFQLLVYVNRGLRQMVFFWTVYFFRPASRTEFLFSGLRNGWIQYCIDE